MRLPKAGETGIQFLAIDFVGVCILPFHGFLCFMDLFHVCFMCGSFVAWDQKFCGHQGSDECDGPNRQVKKGEQ